MLYIKENKFNTITTQLYRNTIILIITRSVYFKLDEDEMKILKCYGGAFQLCASIFIFFNKIWKKKKTHGTQHKEDEINTSSGIIGQARARAGHGLALPYDNNGHRYHKFPSLTFQNVNY